MNIQTHRYMSLSPAKNVYQRREERNRGKRRQREPQEAHRKRAKGFNGSEFVDIFKKTMSIHNHNNTHFTNQRPLHHHLPKSDRSFNRRRFPNSTTEPLFPAPRIPNPPNILVNINFQIIKTKMVVDDV